MELLVVIVLLGILASIAVAALNPKKQLDRAKDAERLHALEQIRDALNTYYNDRNAYPTSLPNGTWNGTRSTVYMEKVPVDPDTKQLYPYETDSSSSPQWAVVYAKLSTLTASCPLTSMGNNCEPNSGFDAGNTACVVLGNIDCNYISSNPMPTP